jgi:hypothetical protein
MGDGPRLDIGQDAVMMLIERQRRLRSGGAGHGGGGENDNDEGDHYSRVVVGHWLLFV